MKIEGILALSETDGYNPPSLGFLRVNKGQKISKADYLVLIFSKKRTKYLPNSALVLNN